MNLPISLLFSIVLAAALLVTNTYTNDPYEYGPASRDGIGKFYMGREI